MAKANNNRSVDLHPVTNQPTRKTSQSTGKIFTTNSFDSFRILRSIGEDSSNDFEKAPTRSDRASFEYHSNLL